MELWLVLLAAGSSRRFFGNKLLYVYEGKPLYRYVADAVCELPPETFAGKVVVTRYEEILEDLQGRGFLTVRNMHSDWGISHSIRLGIETVLAARERQHESLSLAGQKQCEENRNFAICFAVCDQPHLRRETIRQFACAYLESARGIGCLKHGAETGNPVIFSENYLEELLALQGDTGGKAVLKRHLEDVFFYEVADGRELWDLDVRVM